MAFESLTERLQQAMGKLRKKGKVTEADVKEMMREIRLALLEADVNLQVVKEFTKSVRERAVGADVLESVSPAQQIVKIVNEELTKTLGEETVGITVSENPNGYHDGRAPRGRENHFCREIGQLLKEK